MQTALDPACSAEGVQSTFTTMPRSVVELVVEVVDVVEVVEVAVDVEIVDVVLLWDVVVGGGITVVV